MFIAESGFVPEDVAIYAEAEPEAPIELPPVPELPTELLPLDVAQAGAQMPPVGATQADGQVPVDVTQAEGQVQPVDATQADGQATTEPVDADASPGDGV